MIGVRSRRRSSGSSILIDTSPICDKGTRCPPLPTGGEVGDFRRIQTDVARRAADHLHGANIFPGRW